MSASPMKDNRSDKIFSIVNTTLLSLTLIAVLYPLLFIISSSLSSGSAVIAGKVWLWPVNPTLDGYREIFAYKKIWTGFSNSVFYTAFGTTVNITLTIMAAYALSRKDMIGRHVILFLFVFTMLFSGGLIPTYLVVKQLGLLDTRWSLIFPVALTAWNVIIARTFFRATIPDELLEASQIDGSSDFGFFFRMVIPLSAPIIAVLSLFYAVGNWNQYFQALIYIKTPNLFPLQIFLRDILIQNEVDSSMMMDMESMAERDALRQLLKYTLIVVSSVPMIAIYPFVQKHFVKGVMIGSLKG